MIFRFLLASISLVGLLAAERFYLPQETADALMTRYGEGSIKRVNALIELMNRLYDADEKEKLMKVNDFFNAIPYGSDEELWGQSDYWANRIEFIGKNRGDCEDYAFAKYFTLKQLGVDPQKMRAFYCNSLRYHQPHIVLAYFKEGKKIPFLLGNYTASILPATKRTDLQPIKLYNSEDLFIAKLKKMGREVPESAGEIAPWLEVINGIRRGR